MLNPASMVRAKRALDQFTSNHPKFMAFFHTVFQSGIPEGSIIEITVTRPGEAPLTTNMRVQPSDIELFKEIKELS